MPPSGKARNALKRYETLVKLSGTHRISHGMPPFPLVKLLRLVTGGRNAPARTRCVHDLWQVIGPQIE
jgi:hypothetical protein